MHGYSDKHGFMYEKLETADIRNNLMQMSAKLDGLLIGVNDKNNSKSSTKKLILMLLLITLSIM